MLYKHYVGEHLWHKKCVGDIHTAFEEGMTLDVKTTPCSLEKVMGALVLTDIRQPGYESNYVPVSREIGSMWTMDRT